MADFAYTLVTAKLKDLLAKIRDIGVPQGATHNWLASLGYKSTNDRSMVAVLKQINFVDSSGKPTILWNQYRGSNPRAVLAGAIRRGYAQLFETYPDAYARSDTDLENFVSTRTQAGKQVISRTVQTFKALCLLADFTSDTTLQANTPQEIAPVSEAKSGLGIPERISGLETGLTGMG